MRPCNFPHHLLPSPAVAQVTSARPPQTYTCRARLSPARSILWSPEPVVAGALKIRLLREPPAAETVSGSLGKPQGGCLESILGRRGGGGGTDRDGRIEERLKGGTWRRGSPGAFP